MVWTQQGEQQGVITNWGFEAYDVDPGGYWQSKGYTIDPATGMLVAPGASGPAGAPGSANSVMGSGNSIGGSGTGVTMLPNAGPAANTAKEGDRDALARLRQLFGTYGLPASLGDWAWGELQKGVGESEITLSLYDRPEFKTRFPAMEERRRKNLPPITPAEYIAYEGARRQLMMQANLPPGFYDDPADATADIADDRSINELAQRIQTGFVAVKSAPVEVRDAFARLFGADGDAALAAYALDQNRSLTALEKVVASSTAAGMGWRQNVRIDKATAERLGDRNLSAQAYDQGFQQVRQLESLYNQSFGEDASVTQATGIDAAFGDLAAQEKLVARVNQRTNTVAASGSGFGQAAGDRGAYGARQLS
jgi:hypothetical protein